MVNVDAENAREKLLVAVEGMAVSVESIQIRLAHAITHIVVLNEGTFPADGGLRERYRLLMQEMTATSAEGTEGQIMATANHLTDEAARERINRLIRLLCDVSGAAVTR